MTAIFEETIFKNKDTKRFYASQVPISRLGGLFLKDASNLRDKRKGGLIEKRRVSFLPKTVRSLLSIKNGIGVQRTLLNNEGRSKKLWLKPTLNHGSHVGHKTAKLLTSRAWVPPIGVYLVGNRDKVAAIDSHLTLEGAAKGLYLAAAILRRGGHVLVIDTRVEASSLPNLIEISNYRIPVSLSFSGSHWVGGSLTNWDSISVMIRRCAQISDQFDTLITRNRIHIPRYEKMRHAFPGFIKSNHLFQKTGGSLFTLAGKGENLLNFHDAQLRFKRRPDLLWILNPNENRHIIEEAERLSIPTVGMVDSNTDLSNITVAIPVNTDSLLWPGKVTTILLSLSKCLAPLELSQRSGGPDLIRRPIRYQNSL
jgi:small subunit ribosomal protein S2